MHHDLWAPLHRTTIADLLGASGAAAAEGARAAGLAFVVDLRGMGTRN